MIDVNELAAELRAMYKQGAQRRRKTAMVQLFGIKYAAELEDKSPMDIVQKAGLSPNWVNEVRDGTNLSEYVAPKPEYR